MRVLVAPDSFKESMTAPVAARAMARGVRRAAPGADVVELPLADGGEGTTDALVGALGGRFVDVAAHDPLGRPVTARIGVAGGLAVVESAAAIGLGRVAPAERDALAADSRGLADLVRAALDTGARRFVVGLGGTATTDGGAGLLVGLGAVLRDRRGADLPPTPGRLAELAGIDLAGLDPRLAGVRIELACDVTNPLLGPTGAAAVFGPQKGATPAQVPVLDAALARLADVLEAATGRVVRDETGAGAGGGLGAALLALGARRRSGFAVVADAAGLDAAVARADLVLTGEGAVDAQTAAGKVPAGVVATAARLGVPVVVLAGRVDDAGAEALLTAGATAVVPIVADPAADVLATGEANLTRAAATTLRLLLAAALPRELPGGRG